MSREASRSTGPDKKWRQELGKSSQRAFDERLERRKAGKSAHRQRPPFRTDSSDGHHISPETSTTSSADALFLGEDRPKRRRQR